MAKIFGGSKQKSQSTSKSENLAYSGLSQTFSPLTQYATEGASALSRLLGGDRTGFDKYMDTTGFNFERDQGESALGRMFGSKGLRNSGSALKSLVGYNNDLRNKYANDYISKLLGLSNVGTQSGSLLASAGGVSNSQSTSTSKSYNGIADSLGKAASLVAASDRRLKTNIEKVGELANGLGVYVYNYLAGAVRYVGVMADEVKLIQPEALGPEVAGYMTVDYRKVEGWN